LQVNEAQSILYAVIIGDEKNYVNKGEAIAFNGQHYAAHITVFQY
jgi:hypothetical protein